MTRVISSVFTNCSAFQVKLVHPSFVGRHWVSLTLCLYIYIYIWEAFEAFSAISAMNDPS